jgi:WD40 repeat-containing protein SMU1
VQAIFRIMGFNTSYSVGEFTIDSSDIIRLILGYLTSQGLHQSADVLRQESGIGLLGLVNQGSVASQCRLGEWGSILKSFSLCQETPPELHEQVILELAEDSPSNLQVAFSVLKVQRDGLDTLLEEDEDEEIDKSGERLTKSRSLEQKLAALAGNVTKFQDILERRKVLYAKTPKRDRRERLAQQLQEQPQVPMDRLPILLQQAMKWQSHTGQLPWIRELYEVEDPTTKKRKKKKRKHLDLVMGNAAADNNVVVGEPDDEDDNFEPIVQDVYEMVKFGKSATCESALFFSKGLITSSSDGLIEVWNPSYSDLNTTEFPYQKDSVMGHSSPILCMKLSNDSELLASGDHSGKVKVWKLSSGKCLRQYQAHDGSPVTCLDLSRDSSRLLTGSSDGTCREFGLISQTILQEYNGHSSYIHSCSYVVEWEDNSEAASWIVTGSADGTVRLWQKGVCIRILQANSSTKSFVVDATSLFTENPAIHTVLSIPNQNQLLMVPRASTAYLVNLEGRVLQRYECGNDDVFLAACISRSWVYLATQNGDCLVFRIHKGTLESTIREFSMRSTSKATTGASSNSGSTIEVTQLLHHPFKSIIAGFSNDKTQKRGVLTVWK